MQDGRSSANRTGGKGITAGRPGPAARFLQRVLHVFSYGCLSALVLPSLLLVSWRYVQESPVGDPVQRPGTAAGPSREASQGPALPAELADDLTRRKFEDSLAVQKPSFHVESTDIEFGDMPVEQLVLDATEVELNVRELLAGEKARISSFGSAKVSLRISGDALRAQLLPMLEAKGLREPRIDFGTNTVKITGRKKVKLLGSFKLSASARFQVENGNAIGLKITELESGQLNLGVSSLKLDFREEVPPLNLGASYAKVVIDRLEFRGGYLHVEAHALQLPAGAIPRGALDVL
ncbi:MAG: LmeA family phospholipid-binding protein [Planctomycetales bacterium]|nr:LmeA family phospholipid-binding protein [bacterium]UNM09437.1 MAG: LmeA family phospholipid-binding protein [Planctomycetales bacterium]